MDHDFETNPLNKTIRTLTTSWSDRVGDNVYHLNIFKENNDGKRRKMNELDGDAEWAGRVAMHYNLQIPKVEK